MHLIKLLSTLKIIEYLVVILLKMKVRKAPFEVEHQCKTKYFSKSTTLSLTDRESKRSTSI